MRKQPEYQPPAINIRNDAEYVTQIRKYRLITPLFGGGVRPAEADPISVVRVPEIRGHLRFWWRATRGGVFDGSVSKMRGKEEELWGGPSTPSRAVPSRVQLAIIESRCGRLDRPYEVGQNQYGNARVNHRGTDTTVPAYVGFPLQPEQGTARPGMPTRSVSTDVEFTIRITFPSDARADVEAALWSWENLGGIGARTRRGFGALQCLEVDGERAVQPTAAEVEVYLSKGLRSHVVDGDWPLGMTHLSHETVFKITGEHTEALSTWHYLISRLKDYRQQRVSANPHDPGRSLWPEADAIRRQTGHHSQGHEPRQMPSKFPRARLGLPIIYHFKPSDTGDPADHTLRLANGERLASPLILRPIACRGSVAVGVALVLDTPPFPDADLRLEAKRKRGVTSYTVRSNLTRQEAALIPALDGNPDVLHEFLDWLD